MLSIVLPLFLIACGGTTGEGGANIGFSGNDEPTGEENILAAPSTPIVTLTVEGEEIQLSWDAIAEATHYKVYEEEDGSDISELTTDDLIETTFAKNIVIHGIDWANTTFRVDACNDAGCTSSEPASPFQAMVDTIGTAQGSDTQSGDLFGVSAALSADGNTLAIGATYKDEKRGAVYIFVRASSTWNQEEKLTASVRDAEDQFGSSLDLSDDGNTLVVGAHLEDGGNEGINANPTDNSASDSGAIYVFERSEGLWAHTTYIKSKPSAPNYQFGSSVGISGDGSTVVAGAPGQNSNSGLVFIFLRTPTTWVQGAGYFEAPNSDANDRFGTTVALNLAGNVLAVGAPSEDGGATGVGGAINEFAPDSGAVYLFRKTFAWGQGLYVKASNTGSGDLFGSTLTLSSDGNRLGVGAPREDGSATGVNSATNNSALDSGAAYLFTYAEGIWEEMAYVKASNTGAGDLFGSAMALSQDGSRFAVGSREEDSASPGINGRSNNDAPESGSVCTYDFDGTDWNLESFLKAPEIDEGALFGTALDFSSDGETLAIGSGNADTVFTY